MDGVTHYSIAQYSMAQHSIDEWVGIGRYRVLEVLSFKNRKFAVCVTVVASSSPAEGGMGDLLPL